MLPNHWPVAPLWYCTSSTNFALLSFWPAHFSMIVQWKAVISVTVSFPKHSASHGLGMVFLRKVLILFKPSLSSCLQKANSKAPQHFTVYYSGQDDNHKISVDRARGQTIQIKAANTTALKHLGCRSVIWMKWLTLVFGRLSTGHNQQIFQMRGNLASQFCTVVVSWHPCYPCILKF